MKKSILLFLLVTSNFYCVMAQGYDRGCKTEYVDKKLKVENCVTNRGCKGTEHSVIFFVNLTQCEMRVTFRCKVWYNCSNYNDVVFKNNNEYDEWTETILIKPEEDHRYLPTKDYMKTCTCPTYIVEFELIEYAVKEQQNKEVNW